MRRKTGNKESMNVATDYLRARMTGAKEKKERVFLCIGSEKLVFDSLGPMVGTMLKNRDDLDAYVYGTMAEPITALQVETASAFIRRFHPGAEVIVVDSAIGKREEIGSVKFFDRGLRPALGIDREMGVVGDKSVMGIVTTKDKVRSPLSCKVHPESVFALAEKVVEKLFDEYNIH